MSLFNHNWVTVYTLAEQKCVGVHIFAVRYKCVGVRTKCVECKLVVCIYTGRSALECGCNYLNEEEVRWKCAHLHM